MVTTWGTPSAQGSDREFSIEHQRGILVLFLSRQGRKYIALSSSSSFRTTISTNRLRHSGATILAKDIVVSRRKASVGREDWRWWCGGGGGMGRAVAEMFPSFQRLRGIGMPSNSNKISFLEKPKR